MRKLVKVGAILGGIALVAGCGSSKTAVPASGTTSPSSAPGPTSSGTSQTITVMLFGQLQATAFSFPEMADAAKGAADTANAAGGINGHKVKVVVCNDEGNPNIAASCGRTAVQDKVAAVIGGISLYDQTFIPIIQAAGIPYVGNEPLEPDDYTSPVSFPLDGGNPAGFGGAGIALVKAGCKQVGVLNDTSAASSGPGGSGTLLAAGVKAAGGHVVDLEDFTGSSPDFTPAISVLLQRGAKCLGVAETPSAMAKVIGAARQSSDPGILMSASVATVPIQIVQALHGAANGMLLTTSGFTPDSPQAAAFRKDLLAANPKAVVDSPAELSWSGMEAFIQVAKTVPSVNAATMLAAFRKADKVSLPTYPAPIDLATPNPVANYARLFNPTTLVYKVVDGRYQLTSPTPTSVQGALGG